MISSFYDDIASIAEEASGRAWERKGGELRSRFCAFTWLRLAIINDSVYRKTLRVLECEACIALWRYLRPVNRPPENCFLAPSVRLHWWETAGWKAAIFSQDGINYAVSVQLKYSVHSASSA